jgi:hypothetical protein
VIDSQNVVRAGNGTLEAAKQLGWESLACVRSELSASELIAYGIADNRTSELATWNDDVLAASLKALQSEDAELFAATAFTDAELDQLFDPDLPDPTPNSEPELESDHLIEIRCSAPVLHEIQKTLSEWSEKYDCSIDVS